MLRSHQKEALELASNPYCGVKFNRVTAIVTPGGGKSVIPVIFLNEMKNRKIAERVCWITPKDNLRKQAEETFSDPYFRNLLGHRLSVRAAGNDVNPSRECNGYVTTYQAVDSDPWLHREEFKLRKHILVLDEFNHVKKGGPWHKALTPLVDMAALTILMSGTISRADRGEIAFLDYYQEGNVKTPIITSSDTNRVIKYPRTTALDEEAVLPIFFERVDGTAAWFDKNGEEKKVSTLSGIGDDTGAALLTALGKDYAFSLMHAMLSHWSAYKKQYRRSKFLIVAPNITLAKTYLQEARRIGFTKVDIATSEDTEEAKRNIDRFKGRHGPELEGLITVGMAYEGLDNPPITHIACLTHIRSHEWIEQMLARATRVDRKAGEYKTQAAYVWAPDDDLFSEAISRIQTEQAPFIKKHTAPVNSASTTVNSSYDPVIPLTAAMTAVRSEDMQSGEALTHEETGNIKNALIEARLDFLSPIQMKSFLDAYNPNSETKEKQDERPVTLTASERENALRSRLNNFIKQVCAGDGDLIKSENASLVKSFGGKRRSELTETELMSAIRMVEIRYGKRASNAAV